MELLVPEKDHFGCKITTYFRLDDHVKLIKEKLTEAQLKRLRDTSFGFLLNDEVAQWNMQFVHSVLLRQLSTTRCGDEVEEAMYFNFCGNKVRLGSNEFAIITGMKMGDYNTILKQVVLQSEDAKSFKEYVRRGLVDEGKASYDDVLKRFNNLGEISDDRAVAMALLLLYTNVVGNARHSKIEDALIQLALEVDEWNKFPFGSISYERTIISGRACIINASKRDSNSYSIGGFPVVFQVNNLFI